MSAHVSVDKVTAALREPVEDLGVDLESVEIQKAGRRHVVRVVVDRDGGVDLDLVAQVSRCASDVLDSPELAAVLPGPFVLEVSSPGVDRPLTEERHWRRNVGRLVTATLADGTEVTGRISSAPADGMVALASDAGDVAVALADVTLALVQVEFTRIDEE
jgi:ribosome maturation factor RimP